MEVIDLGKIEPKIAWKLVNLGFQRDSMRLLIDEKKDLEHISSKIHNASPMVFARFFNPKESNEFIDIPLAMKFSRSRLDTVYSFIYKTELIKQWKSLAAKLCKQQSLFFELNCPADAFGKHYLESDVSILFKKLRKFPGWKKAVTQGIFYCSLKRVNNQLIVGIQCVIGHSSRYSSKVLLKYVRCCWHSVLPKQAKHSELMPSNIKTLMIKKDVMQLFVPEPAQYLMQKDGNWDLPLIERLVKRNSLQTPKIHKF